MCRAYADPKGTAVDCTCGRGKDTLWLARHCGRVYSFDIQEEALKSTEELLDANYYLTEIAAFCVFIKRIRNERNRLEEEQVQAEMEIEDLLHAIEFNDLPCEQGYELYKKLHEARVRRRSYKNAVAWIDYIMEAKPVEFLRNDPSSRIMGTKYRQYRARALPELFHQTTES